MRAQEKNSALIGQHFLPPFHPNDGSRARPAISDGSEGGSKCWGEHVEPTSPSGPATSAGPYLMAPPAISFATMLPVPASTRAKLPRSSAASARRSGAIIIPGLRVYADDVAIVPILSESQRLQRRLSCSSQGTGRQVRVQTARWDEAAALRVEALQRVLPNVLVATPAGIGEHT